MSSNGRSTGEAASTGPVGQGDHVVREGETIESIAFDAGFWPDTVWNHPDNAELKAARKNRNVLLAGDRVAIPTMTPKVLPRATGQRHRFVRRGVPSKFRLEARRYGEVLRGVKYVLVVDGQRFDGVANGEGIIEHFVPPDARTGHLTIDGDDEVYELSFGYMDPITEMSGVQKRLVNLGYDCAPSDGALNENTRRALHEFQLTQGLPATGEPDAATLAALVATDDL
jgi:hypothetical protein